MASIDINRTNHLTTFTIIGLVDVDQIISAMLAAYNDKPTLNWVWDYTRGQTINPSKENIERILNIASANAYRRPGGKTAFVASRDVEFGILRMFEIWSKVGKVPLQAEVFRSMESALIWLNEKPST